MSVIELDADRMSDRARLVNLLGSNGKREASIEEVRAYIDHDPNAPYGWQMLARAHLLRGEPFRSPASSTKG